MSIEQALRNLVNKLDEVRQHPSFIGAFTMAQIHGMPYTGPTFNHELEAAREELDNLAHVEESNRAHVEEESNLVCTFCDGNGVRFHTGLADGPEGGFVYTHEERCPFCDSGIPKAGWEKWKRVGTLMRKDRELRGLSLSEEAYCRKMSVVDLSAMETGRMEPMPREGLDVTYFLGIV